MSPIEVAIEAINIRTSKLNAANDAKVGHSNSVDITLFLIPISHLY
jgi:hypothetical protein